MRNGCIQQKRNDWLRPSFPLHQCGVHGDGLYMFVSKLLLAAAAAADVAAASATAATAAPATSATLCCCHRRCCYNSPLHPTSTLASALCLPMLLTCQGSPAGCRPRSLNPPRPLASGRVEVWSDPSSKSIPLLLQSLGRGIYPLPNPSPLAFATELLALRRYLAHPLAILSGLRWLQERPRGLQERYDSFQDASQEAF